MSPAPVFAEPAPRLFGLPPGADFAARLVDGLIARHQHLPPEAIARTTLFLNTQRMRRRVREAFLARGAGFLPRLRLVTDLKDDPLLAGRGPATSALGRRLELAVLIEGLLAVDPDLAPRAALYELADSLAALMDEMRAEDVPPERLTRLDLEGHSAHWARTRRFVTLVEDFFGDTAPPDAEARTRKATEALIALWQRTAPPDPIVIAGSTGSRGTTAYLMEAVVRLPQGALLLPGYDFDMPDALWPGLDEGPGQEDHPQFRYWKLARRLGVMPAHIRPWDGQGCPDPARNALISLSLRAAPVTDQWISQGPELGDLRVATQGMTLIEAPDPRSEAQAIALALREAIARGERATLLTPDRDLTRRVSAALDRWNITPDDSAGEPLLHAPPGRFLRLIARAMGKKPPVDQLLTLLKHPLAFAGKEQRGVHQLLLHELEIHLRKNGPAFPQAADLEEWAARKVRPHPQLPQWVKTLGHAITALAEATAAPMPDMVARHRALAELWVQGMGADGQALWARDAGEATLRAIEELAQEAPASLYLSLPDYHHLLDGILSRGQVRRKAQLDTRIDFLGAQEARVQGSDLVILGGLTEGVWPKIPDPDPWLNRKMRLEAGLLLPERRIGLAAHDYQMAVGAPRVILSRAARNAEAETVPSRWLNRLTNLLEGLKQTHGPEALGQMRARGQALLSGARAVEAPLDSPLAARPSPRPPLHLRPKQLSLTEIEKLIRDPYAIYAKHILRLQPLPPAHPLADARLRGEILHRVPEAFIKAGVPSDVDAAARALMAITDQILEEAVAWPAMRAVWRARMAELARPFAEGVLADGAKTLSMERKYAIDIPDLDFKLVGKPDRIDLTADGRLRIVDYKTGIPPSLKQQQSFAKQLHLAAVMAWLGAFPETGLHETVDIQYVQLKRDLKTVATSLGAQDLEKILEEFRRLILAYRNPQKGYTARRAMVETRDSGDYDDLARYGEWDVTDSPKATDLPDLPQAAPPPDAGAQDPHKGQA